MWLAFYNESLGDVLLLTSGPIADDDVHTESVDNITVIRNKHTNQVVSLNIFNIIDKLGITTSGPVELNDQQVASINQLLEEKLHDVTIEVDNRPKFVVGHVEECVPHEDSDHLSVTQTNVGNDELLQIVCGASNIQKGLNVLVAKAGAVMPNGSIIWDGELRGVPSRGMICSTRELGLQAIEDLPGIWELDRQFKPGTELKEVIQTYQA